MTRCADETGATERLVLEALGARGIGRTPAEVVDDTGLLPLAVRACLRDLARRGLAHRGTAGRWMLEERETARA